MRFVAHATKVSEGPCRAGLSLPEYRTRMMDYEGKKERKRRPSHRGCSDAWLMLSGLPGCSG